MTKEKIFNRAENIVKNYPSLCTIYPINRCKARVYETLYGEYILQSNQTVVAVYSKKSNAVYIRDYYSHTITQHISKFIKKIYPNYVAYLYKQHDRIYLKDLHKGITYKHPPKNFSVYENDCEKIFKLLEEN